MTNSRSLRLVPLLATLVVACAAGGDGTEEAVPGPSAGAAGQTNVAGAAGTAGGGVAGEAGAAGEDAGGSSGSSGKGGASGKAGSGGKSGASGGAGASGKGGSAGAAGVAGTTGDGGTAGSSVGGSAGNAGSGGSASEGGAAGSTNGGAGSGGSAGGPTDPGESLPVPGGTFSMGRGTGTDGCPAGMKCFDGEAPEHAVTVSAFSLDTYEVTVGRFRAFVAGYPGNQPVEGAGAHPKIAGTGWQSAWTSSLPKTQEALRTSLGCDASFATWTDEPSVREDEPIACVGWYTALAFCIADGGRLPTEAEWEMAAAGGDENRLYPWGAAAADHTRASYGGVDGTDPHAKVGAYPAGKGRFGHHDLGGGRWGWVFDAFDAGFYAGAGQSCVDCANTTGAARTLRGGGWTSSEASHLRATARYLAHAPTARHQYLGFRCARQ